MDFLHVVLILLFATVFTIYLSKVVASCVKIGAFQLLEGMDCMQDKEIRKHIRKGRFIHSYEIFLGLAVMYACSAYAWQSFEAIS
jgi:hypothetical protein